MAGTIRGETVHDSSDGPEMDHGVPDCASTSLEQAFALLSVAAPEGWRVELITPEAFGTGRVIPDLAVARKGTFAGKEVWHDPSAVLLVAEVTSHSTADRDRDKKIHGYARAGIPVYLLIDREAGEVTVHSKPSGADYAKAPKYKLGQTVPLPAPLGFDLDTSEF
ncbi:Uma2 family endonuclease [Streptomyces sp. NPDC001340]